MLKDEAHQDPCLYSRSLSVYGHALEWCCVFHEHALMVSDRYSPIEGK